MEGHVSFDQCDTEGGGESPPGRGGNVFNGDTGFILFEGGVTMQETYLTVSSLHFVPVALSACCTGIHRYLISMAYFILVYEKIPTEIFFSGKGKRSCAARFFGQKAICP